MLTEADAGHTEFMDEVFQNETRFPGGEWKAASEPYTDVVRPAGMQIMCSVTEKETHMKSLYLCDKQKCMCEFICTT